MKFQAAGLEMANEVYFLYCGGRRAVSFFIALGGKEK